MSPTPAFAHLCPGCFADNGQPSICANCDYDESLKRGPLVLPHRTLLHHGQYLIGKVLGKSGGFGITYLALDTKLETRVAIKEYLPRDLAGRDGDHATVSAHSSDDAEHFRYGLTQFLQEARTLARFDHANIVRVRNFFEENGTGYLVMDYYDGVTLADYLAQQPQGKLPERTAVDILMPILDGLREVHAKNFLHRDIKPQNIYLTTGNRAILLDFGAARQAMSERSRSLSVVLSEGYAPYEQYHRRGEQGPWTDIYACAAVLYHAVTGEPPPPATERMSRDELSFSALGVSASLANALRLGLAVDHKNRPQTMAAFQALLWGCEACGAPDVVQNSIDRISSFTNAKSSQSQSQPNMWPEFVEAASGSEPSKIDFPKTQSNPPSGKRMGWQFWVVVLLAPTLMVGFIILMITTSALFSKPEKNTVPSVAAPGSVEAKPDIKPVTASGGEKLKADLVTYKEEKKLVGTNVDQSAKMLTTVVALIDGKRLEVPGDVPGQTPVALIAQKDFNGDGVMDALIEVTHLYGGSGEWGESMFITIADGKIVFAPVAEGTIVEEGRRFMVKAESDDATDYWGFDGQKAIMVRSVPHRKLAAITEFRTKGGLKDNEVETLETDLDMDGKSDRITCHISTRWGMVTSCVLPLPGGRTQEVELRCVRVGVLKTQSNGYRELVCNNNAVIRFDGNVWVQLKPAP
jgi:serine/threonine protein kinase